MPTDRRRSRALRIFVVVTALCASAGALGWASACETTGAAARGERLARMERSPQWQGDGFYNKLDRVDGPAGEMMRQWLFGGQENREPGAPLPVQARTRADYAAQPATGLRVTWLGHSTMLLEIDGARVLVDPVWGERASPFSWAGPKRFYAPPLPMDQLPPIDVVVISHDHYDHLDTETVKALSATPARFVVPLGIGAHLEEWGVEPSKIVELDWWESTTEGALVLTATPARHFSGRWLDDSGQTLWAGWAIVSSQRRVFYSGDTALHDGFAEIGTKLGPFDLTMIEVGAYDALWADVHLGPEQAVRAHQLVRGDVMMPVHWGLFDLALHGWTEPMERTLAAAKREQVRVVAPRPGDVFEPSVAARAADDVARWWPPLPWRTVLQAPAWSSGVDHLGARR